MMSIRVLLEERLRAMGYRERRIGIFEATKGRRIVAIVEATTNPSEWHTKTNSVLRQEPFAAAPVWSRYVVVAVDGAKTVGLAVSAAAFCRDVSKCRRLVAFTGQQPNEVLPFLGLSGVLGTGTPRDQDVAEVVHRTLDSRKLANSFLDDHLALTRVQEQAEAPED